jgi:hypothetical protein
MQQWGVYFTANIGLPTYENAIMESNTRFHAKAVSPIPVSRVVPNI